MLTNKKKERVLFNLDRSYMCRGLIEVLSDLTCRKTEIIVKPFSCEANQQQSRLKP